MDMVELAERCEKATGVDWKIDEAIQASLAGAEIEWQEYAGSNAYHRDGRWVSIGVILPYTGSLDAAMTLVPAEVNIGLHVDHNGCDCAWASRKTAWQPRVVPGNSPALALCAAALRARAALSDQPRPTEEDA